TPSLDNATDEAQPYTVERIMLRKGKILPNKRVICDIGFVIHQARDLEIHSYECKFCGALVFSHIQYSGLGATLLFKCSNFLCSKISRLHSDQEVECLNNQLAVLGALSTGSGFSREKFSVMNITYMSKHVFASCERTTRTILDACVESNLADCINERKVSSSQSHQDIDTDGYYCLTAIVDGGWCKRSCICHGYNCFLWSPFVIIGMATQKLYLGIQK
ncbi:uncharacterized protein TNIN_138511, partial [Trichonephila inaurata madagascariensis]